MPSTVDPVRPIAAIEYFRDKLRMTPDEFSADVDANHQKAFTVAGVADLDVIDDVFAALDKAISDGSDFRDFKVDVLEKLESAWGGTVANPGWRLETIFRTNIQSSYQAGRMKEARASQDDRPYGMLSFVDDDRQSDICADLSDEFEGKAIPLDDPIWSKIWPPNHHNCRDDVVTLSESEAREMGVLDDVPDPEDVEVGEGFESQPDEFGPDPEEYAPELQEDLERFLQQ